MDKTNFLKIYGRAHVRALTEANIRAAFRKTGLWPIDRAVITPAMMAPSLEMAMHGNLPIAPSTPVRVVIDRMHEIHQRAKRPRSPDSDNEGIATGHQGSLASYLDNSFQMVRSTSAAFLVNSSPIQSTSTPPTFVPVPISPYSHKKARYSDLLVVPPSNMLEEELQNSVRELLAANKEQKSLLISMQSSLVLNGAYCDLVQGQLTAQEESKKSKKKGRLVGDGMPRLLTSKDFVRRVVAFQKAAEEKEAEMKKRRATKAERSTAMSQWKELEKARKAENAAIRARWQEDVKAWEEERDRKLTDSGRLGTSLCSRVSFSRPFPSPLLSRTSKTNLLLDLPGCLQTQIQTSWNQRTRRMRTTQRMMSSQLLLNSNVGKNLNSFQRLDTA
jgi:hypothetical protein